MTAPGVARLATKVWTHPANERRRLAQLVQAVRFQLRGRILRKPTLVPLGEQSTLLATLDSSAAILVAYANPPDYDEWQVWRRFLRSGDLFVDVGANIGTYSILAAERGARVIAVEPNVENVRRLRANLDLNGYEAEVWEIALTDSPSMLHFTTHLDCENHIAAPGTPNTVAVRGETFDVMIENRHVRGMKIDVEGAELQVLRGAGKALAAGRIELLQLEWNDYARRNYGESRHRAAELLAEHGYRLYRPNGYGGLASSDAAEGSDVFAARPEVAKALA
jgi:FkbM family methyltransferase